MTGHDEVLTRLRAATPAERDALAKALEVQLERDPEEAVVRLADAYRKAASERDYRTILVSVAKEVASQAEWSLDEIPAVTETAWLEDYIYLTLGFIHRSERRSLSDYDKAKERARAEEALHGKLPAAHEQTSGTLVGLAVGVALWFLVGWPAVLGSIAVLSALGWLSEPSKKVPATLMLIHVRKRQEFEAVLAGAST